MATLHRRSSSPANAQRTLARRLAGVTLVAAVGVAGVVAFAGASSPLLIKTNVASFTGVLANSRHHTYYLSTSEKNGALHCKGPCESTWFPLLVGRTITSVSLGPGVEGIIGFVRRTHALKQVTYNGYPIYLFSHDRINQALGVGINAFGGTWLLVNASASTAATTSVSTPQSSRTTITSTTTTSAVTTTTRAVTAPTRPATTTTAPVGGGTGF